MWSYLAGDFNLPDPLATSISDPLVDEDDW